MKTILTYLIISIMLTNIMLVSAQQEVELAITNVNLIDGTGSAIQLNKTILIKGERIFKVVDATQTFKATNKIDGTGKYLIPGLFEGHFHIGYDEGQFPNRAKQLIHFGITSVLIPGADNRKLLRFKSKVKQEGFIAPTIYHTSLMTTIEGRHPLKTYGADYYTDGINVNLLKSEADIPRIVNEAVADEAIAIKLMIEDGPTPPFVTRIPNEYVAAISQQAQEADLKFFAHVSDMDEVKIAVSNNADALMHFTGVQINWEKNLDYIKKLAAKNVSWVSTAMIAKSFFYPLNKNWIENQNFDVFESSQIDYFNDPDGTLERESRAILKAFAGTDDLPMNAMIAPLMRDLKKINDAGVNVVVGSDVGGRPFILPGISVHEEMQLFALGGFTPTEIIKCASLNAAKMLGVDADYGSIEEGKMGDMVLLNKNPLEDIANTLSIHTVYKNGRPQPRIKK